MTEPDFEAPTDGGANNVYGLTVRVSDGLLGTTQGIAVTVTNVAGVTSNGTSGSDTLIGTNEDTLNGLAGDDRLTGLAGNDVVNGGDGDDILVATVNDGNDSYNGGAGTDTYDMSGTSAAAVVNLGTFSATSAQTGTDTLIAIENVTGGSGNDTINVAEQLLTGSAGQCSPTSSTAAPATTP